MKWMPDRYRELRSLLRVNRLEDDVDEELLHHIELRRTDLERGGLSAAAAHEEALRRFGDVSAVRRETCAIEHDIQREQRRMEFLDAARREARHAVRSLMRAPLFTIVAVLTLGLGIGATTAIFTLIDSIVLRPMPYPAPSELVQIRHAVPKVGPDQKWGNSVAGYFFYADRNASFDELGAYGTGMFSLSGDGRAERVDGARVSASLLRVLGLKAVRGRLFSDADDLPGASQVVLVSHELWQSRYGGDPDIVGRTISLNAAPATVIGVMAPGARLPLSSVQVWAPMQLDRSAPPVNSHWVNVYARLRDGVTPEAALVDLERLASLMPEAFPAAYSEAWYESSGFAPDLTTLREHVLGRMDGILWLVLGAVSVVLLIAAANVANLHLVRAEARRREQTVRAALGAERAHLAVQYLAESSMLGLLSAGVGIFLAWIGIRLLVMLSPPGVPRLDEVALGGSGVVFAVTTALLTAVVFGIVPVVRSHSDFSELRESGRGMTPSRERHYARSILVVGQVGLALVLLTAGGLMLQSFVNLRNVQSGIEADGLLTFGIYPPEVRYPTQEDQLRFRRDLVDRISGLPGVTHVSATTRLPFGGESGCVYTTIEGKVYSSSDLPPCMPLVNVLPGYFEAMSIGVTGESFSWNDIDRASGNVVVSRAFAQRMWPGENPVGKGVMSYQNGPPWYRVAGVADDVHGDGLDRPAVEAIYYPPRAIEGACCGGTPPNTLVVRSAAAESPALAASIRDIVTDMDPEVPLAELRTMNDVVRSSEAVARGSFTLLLLGIAAVMALFLSAVGLYGVIAYLVGQRRAEIGVRMALGARVTQVSRMVIMQSVRLTLAGIAIGLAGSLITARTLSSLLFEVRPGDPRVFVFVSVILLLVSLLASLIPALRAARTDPSEALRAE